VRRDTIGNREAGEKRAFFLRRERKMNMPDA
jgi:hypothetical protein